MWCIPKVTPEFVGRMEDVLDLYKKDYDVKEPVICMDEESKQLIADTRENKPVRKGNPKKIDYEYKRNGTQNIFMAVEPKPGFRKTKITGHRKCPDFANFIKEIINLNRYRNTKKIHIVLDNLNTHFEKSFYKTFPKMETEKILNRIKFHHTPKHASWLNMAEIEIGIMDRQCTKGRIPSGKSLTKNISIWQKNRN